MSVINRIEVASLLNKHGDISSRWEAKMRHLVLNLKGQSTAMNMENGFGKTTLSDALIGILSRDRTLIRKTRQKMSPSKDGRPWTHIRVEFRYSSGYAGQSDMLAITGDSVGGEEWVFGMYGHSDTDPGFYYYRGRLEELPVSSITADGKLQLFSNDHFRQALRQMKLPPEQRPGDRESWLEAISLHISRKELEQLASFQKEGGADKSQIFNAVKLRAGEKADQAFFYEVLAPQILAGASQGETDESEEFIEDLIMNSGHKVSELRHRISEKTNDLQRNRNKLDRLQSLDRESSKLSDARTQRNEARKKLVDQANCLIYLSQKGFPGLPANPGSDSKASELARELTIRPGETESLVPLSVLAKVTSTGIRKIEEYFESKQLSGYRHDRIPLVYHPEASWTGGKSMRLYPASTALKLLGSSQQLFKDDAERVNNLELLQDAVDCFLDMDSNPFRENYLANETYLKSLQDEVKALKEKRVDLDQKREELEFRDKEFTDNETVYTDALREGLFTEQELESPDITEADVREHLKAVNDGYDGFLKREGRFSNQVIIWEEFQRDNGLKTKPEELIQEKDLRLEELEAQRLQHNEQKNRQQEQEKELSNQLQNIGLQLPRLETEFQQLDRQSPHYEAVQQQFPGEDIQGLISRLEHKQRQKRDQKSDQVSDIALTNSKLQEIMGFLKDYQAFCTLFPDLQPKGLEDSLWKEKEELGSLVYRQEEQISKLQVLVSDLRQFQEQFPDNDPSQWLTMAQQEYPELLTEQSLERARIDDVQRQLEDLETDPVSPGATEVQCSRLLNDNNIPHQSLHSVITELLGEDDHRSRQWLAQAHNLLFAPVLDSNEKAIESADLFARQRLPVPVFTRQSLQQAADNGTPTLMGAVIGHESLAVMSLLDPAFIEDWRKGLNEELQRYQKKLSIIEQKLKLYDPESNSVLLAKSAVEALNQNAVAALPQQEAALEENQRQFQQLKEQLTSGNRKLIRSAESFLDLGGEPAIAEYEHQLQSMKQELDLLTQQLTRLDEQLTGEQRKQLDLAEQFLNGGGSQRLSELKQELELLRIERQQRIELHSQCREAVESHEQQINLLQDQARQVYQPGEKDRLTTLDHYLKEGGPEFMAKAEAVKASLESQRSRAQERASLKFGRIRAYLNARDNQDETAALKKHIADIKITLKNALGEQEAKEAEIDRLRVEQPQQLKAIRLVDDIADRWLKQLSHFSESMLSELSEPDIESLESMPLFEKAEQYLMIFQTKLEETEQISHSAMVLSEQLELENIKELSGELKHREKDHDVQKARFLEELERISTHEHRLFNSTEQARLSRLDSADSAALQELVSMSNTLTIQIKESEEQLTLLQESMAGKEDELNERLTSIIMHSVDNLDILRKVAKKSSGDNAFFVIKADTVSEEGVRDLVRSLLAEIEDNQKQIRSRKAKNLPVGSEEKQRKDLQKDLRSQIYRRLFTNISIQLKHKAIRSHGNLFSLNESMSEGQREAVSLMWLVKLSEFAIERELKSVASQYRRKERKSSESVIILDGLFSKLSHKKLIEDSLESLRNTRGRFQMIGLIHNPNYENDSSIFPTYLVGNVIGGLQGQGGHVTVNEGGAKVDPASVGRGMGEASLFHLHVDNKTS